VAVRGALPPGFSAFVSVSMISMVGGVCDGSGLNVRSTRKPSIMVSSPSAVKTNFDFSRKRFGTASPWYSRATSFQVPSRLLASLSGVGASGSAATKQGYRPDPYKKMS
jgi:hypothetical protein